MRQGGLDIAALLLLNEIVQWLAHRHRGPYLLCLFTQRGWRRCSAANLPAESLAFSHKAQAALDRVLQLTHIAWIIVVAKDIDRFRIDLLVSPVAVEACFCKKWLLTKAHLPKRSRRGGISIGITANDSKDLRERSRLFSFGKRASFVAPTTRTFTGELLLSPTRRTSRSCKTRSSFVCNCGAMELTSSRKIVPRFASSNNHACPRLRR